MTDPVNHPPHYKAPNGLEAIDVIEGFDLNFRLGNLLKYVLRKDRKGAPLQDLRKARWYLDREIAALTAAEGKRPDDLRRHSLCYLATPYTKFKDGIDVAFRKAAEIAAGLLFEGVKVYSPIAHTHPLAIYGDLDPLDHNIWLPFDQAMMDACDALIVAHMTGWDKSFGVTHEIEQFELAGKPIYDLNPQTFAVQARSARAAS